MIAMRKSGLIIAALAVAALAGVGLYGFVLREEPLPRGELFDSLRAETDDDRLTEVFARFVPVEAGFDEQSAILFQNGFRCGVVPASVEGSRYLSCDRPIEGTGYCQGFRYFSYEAAAGEIIETLGSAFDNQRDRNLLGQCEEARQHFFALSDTSLKALPAP
jgi:hypothetical protein